MESLFDRVFNDAALFAPALSTNGHWGTVPIAVWQDDDHVFVEAEIAGVAEPDLEVVVHDGVLYIRGERKPVEGRKYLFNGRSFGKFERAVTLPDQVNTEAVEAQFKDGVLLVSLAKCQAAKPRRISLKTS
jgi:HSP20 family protein